MTLKHRPLSLPFPLPVSSGEKDKPNDSGKVKKKRGKDGDVLAVLAIFSSFAN